MRPKGALGFNFVPLPSLILERAVSEQLGVTEYRLLILFCSRLRLGQEPSWRFSMADLMTLTGSSLNSVRGAVATLRKLGWVSRSSKPGPAGSLYRLRVAAFEGSEIDPLEAAGGSEVDPQRDQKLIPPPVAAYKERAPARVLISDQDRNKTEKRSRTSSDDDRQAPANGEAITGTLPVAASDSGAPPVPPGPPVESVGPVLREACGDWQERYDGTPPGARIGKALKPLVARVAKRLGCGLVEAWRREARAAWGAYLDASPAQFASVERFAQTYGSWAGTESNGGRQAPRPAEPKRDYGENTAAAALAEIHAARPDLKAKHEAWKAQALATHEAEQAAKAAKAAKGLSR